MFFQIANELQLKCSFVNRNLVRSLIDVNHSLFGHMYLHPQSLLPVGISILHQNPTSQESQCFSDLICVCIA